MQIPGAKGSSAWHPSLVRQVTRVAAHSPVAHRLRATISALLFAIAGLSSEQPSVAISPLVAERVRAVHYLGEWNGAHGSARSLSVLVYSTTTLAERVLLTTPVGSRFVFSSITIAPSGTQRQRLDADSTGWWLEVKSTVDFKAKSFDEMTNALAAEKHRWHAVLETSDGNRVESDDTRLLASLLKKTVRGGPARLAVPDEKRSLPFLLHVTGNQGECQEWRLEVEILSELLGVTPRPEPNWFANLLGRILGNSALTPEWKFTRGPYRKERAALDPDVAQFVNGFRSIAGSDLMGDFDPRQVPGPRSQRSGPSSRRDARQN
jgi:hypothetical protein